MMQTVGERFMYWIVYQEERLTDTEKARCYDEFAAGFEVLPQRFQPHEAWASSMAYLCRRLAKRHRGEPVGEWVPEWERQPRRD